MVWGLDKQPWAMRNQLVPFLEVQFLTSNLSLNWFGVFHVRFQQVLSCLIYFTYIFFSFIIVRKKLQSLIRSSLPCCPRPGQAEERLHNSAKRHDAALPCEIRWLQIPLCTGYDDDDEPVISYMEWPFVLPHLLVP